MRCALYLRALRTHRRSHSRLNCALVTAIDRPLSCTRKVPQLYSVILVGHLGGRFYIFSSSSNSSASSSSAAPPTTTRTNIAHAANANHLALLEVQRSSPGTLPDEMASNSPEDRAGSGGVTSDSGSASMGTMSPGVAAAARPPPPSFGGSWDRCVRTER
jgi:hypothetical protein